jgi:formiminotetrahydrofolate cyclodeaminase
MDSPTDLLVKQQAMFDLMEDIIAKMDYNVLTDIEPAVSIGIDAGTFITGWTTTITFN